MDDNGIIYQTRTSQLNNFVYFFLTLAVFGVLAYFYLPVLNIFNTLLGNINELTLQKEDNIVSLSSQIISGVIISIPLFMALWRYLKTRLKIYTITDDRLIYDYGVLNRKRDYVELFRIKDFHFTKPFYLRPFGLCHFHIISTDRRFPYFTIKAVKGIQEHENEIRERIEELRKDGKGREVDIV